MTQYKVELDASAKDLIANADATRDEYVEKKAHQGLGCYIPCGEVDTEEMCFTSEEGRDIDVSVIRPSGTSNETLPLFLFLKVKKPNDALNLPIT